VGLIDPEFLTSRIIDLSLIWRKAPVPEGVANGQGRGQVVSADKRDGVSNGWSCEMLMFHAVLDFVPNVLVFRPRAIPTSKFTMLSTLYYTWDDCCIILDSHTCRFSASRWILYIRRIEHAARFFIHCGSKTWKLRSGSIARTINSPLSRERARRN
jgi:hypothetical protein